MDIKRENPIPVYQQLKGAIRQRINTGEWPRGWKIPSEPVLSKSLNLSRGTVRKAVADLINDGLLESRQGDGTYVTGWPIEQRLMGFYSFAREAEEQGLEFKSRVLEWKEESAGANVAARLKMNPEERILRVKRLRILADMPILLETCHFPARLVSELRMEDFVEGALYDALQERCRIYVNRAEEAFEAIALGGYEAEFLEVSVGSPALMVERLAYTIDNKPIELRFSVMRGDKCRYYIELK